MSENFEDLVAGAEEAFEHRYYDEARKQFEEALLARPYPCSRKSRIYRRLGEIAYRSEDLPASRDYLHAAEAGFAGHCCTDADRQAHVETLLLLAHIHRDLGEAQESSDALSKALLRGEHSIMETWRPVYQLALGLFALGGLAAGFALFRVMGLAVLSWVGFPLMLLCLGACGVVGAVLAIVLENLAGPAVVRWRMRRTLARMKVRAPLALE